MISRTLAAPPGPGAPAAVGAAASREPAPAATDWRRQLAGAVSSVSELLALLELEPEQVPGVDLGEPDFPLRVPHGFVARMRVGDPEDPLLRQVLPLAQEHLALPGYVDDPLAEAVAAPVPGLLHKYHGRVLWVATGACAIHCRYCFRRHYPYEDHQPWGADGQRALAYIAADESIEEVILSGGDPLSASDERLAAWVEAVEKIPHVRRLRLHTRLPIVLPERVDERLLEWLSSTRLRTVVVIHANHARELDQPVAEALTRLRRAGALLLNQSVLLKGVNDRLEALVDLSKRLFEVGVQPYYLNVLDRVRGAAHFEVDEAEALELIRQLEASLPGYLVPKLVRECPDQPSKVPVERVAGG